MKRRAFLGAAAKASAAIALVAADWPHFLREAFADEGTDAKARAAQSAEQAKRDRLALLSDAYRRAQRAGKPLLAIVVPSDNSDKWVRGQYFGNWLNHGSVEQRWPLALCEVVCAGMDDLRQLVPTVGLGEPLMVLIETDQVPATVRRLEAKMPAEGAAGAGRHFARDAGEWAEQQRREDEEIETRIAVLSKLLQAAVADGPQLLEKRANQLRAALAPETARIEIASAGLRADQADTLAALVALTAQQADRTERAALHKLLADAAGARLRKQRIPGSYWARQSGCGTTVEGAEDRSAMVACGMGHVPEKSQRFLYFFTVPKHGNISDF